MTTKIPQRIEISIFRPVRHANILRTVMNIHFRDDRPEAIVPVMITLDKNELAVQSLFEEPVFFNPAFPAALENKIAQKKRPYRQACRLSQ
ncbi:MAG: hypothetical protein HQL20_04935 [Candidatus Omnitrophica bacterium]|nr:hypothetical protein [Candidatus Omnitrophota bacterium]